MPCTRRSRAVISSQVLERCVPLPSVRQGTAGRGRGCCDRRVHARSSRRCTSPRRSLPAARARWPLGSPPRCPAGSCTRSRTTHPQLESSGSTIAPTSTASKRSRVGGCRARSDRWPGVAGAPTRTAPALVACAACRGATGGGAGRTSRPARCGVATGGWRAGRTTSIGAPLGGPRPGPGPAVVAACYLSRPAARRRRRPEEVGSETERVSVTGSGAAVDPRRPASVAATAGQRPGTRHPR